jgi:hypothetical protein
MITLAELTLYNWSDDTAQAELILDEVNDILRLNNITFWGSVSEIKKFNSYDNGRYTFLIPQHKLEDGIYTIKSYQDSNYILQLQANVDYYLNETVYGAVKYFELEKEIHKPFYLEVNGKWGISADDDKPQILLNIVSQYIRESLNQTSMEGLEFKNLSMGGVRIESKTKTTQELKMELINKLYDFN